MVKRLNESFSDEDHSLLLKKKDVLCEKVGFRVNWHDYLLHVTGVRKVKKVK